jgi:hypothetical protein
MLALVNINQNHLSVAREMAEAAQKYDVLLSNHSSSAMLGVVALLQGDRNTGKEAFTAAVNKAGHLLALTPDRYKALDVNGLCFCGLALCGDSAQIPAAKISYTAARAVTSDAGIVCMVLQYFDALAQADTEGILAEVRPFAAGIAQTPQQ